MNFFGHAVVAHARSRDPVFLLGAMLPDLAAMAGLRVRGVADPGARAGLALHVATDAAFHAAPRFTALVASASIELRARGLRRGPALGVAHVAPELLLDGWLAERHGVPAAYFDALAASARVGALVRWQRSARAWPFPELCRSVASAPIPEAYRNAAFVAERVIRALARRERLALTPAERVATRSWLHAFAPQLAREAEALFDELSRGLAAREAELPLVGLD